MKIIFLGPQGSGKSTQAKLISDQLKLPYLEAGQLLRDRATQNDDLGKRIKSVLDAGHLVDDKITIGIIKDNIRSKGTKGYLLDGFPRNEVQYNALDSKVDLVFYVKVSDKEAIRRLMLRGRSDDANEALKKRLEIYHKQTEPLISKFASRKILKEIDGDRPVENIHEDISRIVKSYQKDHEPTKDQ